MIQIDVKADISQALAKFARISSEVKDKAVVRALNKTAAMAKTQASKEIRAVYFLKAKKVNQVLRLARAYAGRKIAAVSVSGHPVPLLEYSARQTNKGVTVNVKNGRRLIPGAFIATMSSGHRGVFVRRGAAHKKVLTSTGRVVWSGLPIDELFGPSIPSAFNNKLVQEALDHGLRENFPRIFAQELRYASLK